MDAVQQPPNTPPRHAVDALAGALQNAEIFTTPQRQPPAPLVAPGAPRRVRPRIVVNRHLKASMSNKNSPAGRHHAHLLPSPLGARLRSWPAFSMSSLLQALDLCMAAEAGRLVREQLVLKIQRLPTIPRLEAPDFSPRPDRRDARSVRRALLMPHGTDSAPVATV